MSAALVLALVMELSALSALSAQPVAPPAPVDPSDAPIEAPAAPAATTPPVLTPPPDAPRKKRAPLPDDSVRSPSTSTSTSTVVNDGDRPERMLRGAVAGGVGAAASAALVASFLYVEAAAPGHVHDGVLLAAAAAAPGIAAIAGGSLALAFGMNAPTGNDFAWVWACTGLGYVAAVGILVLIVAAPVGGSCLSGLLSCRPGTCGGPPSTSSTANASPAGDIPPRGPLIVAGATAVISAAGMLIAGAAYWEGGTQSSRFLAGAATGAIVGAAVGGTLGGAAVGALSP